MEGVTLQNRLPGLSLKALDWRKILISLILPRQ
jgi:hypothetical protein